MLALYSARCLITANARIRLSPQVLAPRLLSFSNVATQTGNNQQLDGNAEDAPAPLSNRKKFKQIPINQKVLQYIRDNGVCKPMRRARRRKLDRAIGGRHNLSHVAPPKPDPPPLPFGPKAFPAKVRHTIRSDEENLDVVFTKLVPKDIPAVALIGRSNVGKSTLLNALIYGNRRPPTDQEEAKQKSFRGRQKPVLLPRGPKAAMSAKPGETKDITFYELAGKNDAHVMHKLWLADLPGYGFAHATPEASQSYQNLMITYLCHSHRPRRLLLLLDARHGLKQSDRQFLQDLQQRQDQLPPLQIVLTKCDLVDALDLARRHAKVKQDVEEELRRQPSNLPVLFTSATRQNGILAVQKELARLASRQ